MTDLNEPHGGELVDLLVPPARNAEIQRSSRDCPSWDLNERQLCDLELLLTGGFAPLAGFLGRRDYESVVASMRLSDGTLWPIPVTLDVSAEVAARLALARPWPSATGKARCWRLLEVVLAAGPGREARPSTEPTTPASGRRLAERAEPSGFVGGPIADSPSLAPRLHRPAAHAEPSCAASSRDGWRRIVAFQTRNPLHRAHFELTLRAAREREPSCSSIPWWADEARRSRPLHARELLSRDPPALPSEYGQAWRSCPSPCAWPAPGRRSGTRSSARTTAVPT